MDKRTQNAFLGKARHNLKNPVNAILGYSEMLIEDCEDEGFISLIPDIRKLNQAGNDILSSIEEIFSDKALAESEQNTIQICRAYYHGERFDPRCPTLSCARAELLATCESS